MPGKVKVKILQGRNLPVMDRGSDTTDAYVEIKFGTVTHKTDVCRKSLNPQWNSDWYRFEADDAELQDEPLQIRLMDHDTYSANDAIGKVNISLNPLLLPPVDSGAAVSVTTHSGKGSFMSGWIPVFDTMHGIRGEVNVIVKVDLFSDANKFRQSSCGVQFFHSPAIPYGFTAQIIHGFVEELVVNDDPEYQWIDKIRTPRASNEARQVVFLKLSGQVQRKIGLKAIDLGANAVIGYSQYFDLEGDVGVVARGIGTAVTLIKTLEILTQTPFDNVGIDENEAVSVSPKPVAQFTPSQHHTRTESTGGRISQSPAKNMTLSSSMTKDVNGGIGGIFRRSSDSDLSVTPKGNSLTSGERLGSFVGGIRPNIPALTKAPLNPDNLDMLEYPFLTISKYPPGFILHIGGTVAARTVKLLERVPNPDEPETRDSWWTELRMEIRSHARALGCNFVIGYSEVTAISEEVCILSATGTAAVINFHGTGDISASSLMTSSLDRQEFDSADVKESKLNGAAAAKPELKEVDNDADLETTKDGKESLLNSSIGKSKVQNCSICHIPYLQSSMPFKVTMKKCAICKKGKVPDVILATIEIPETIQIIGRGCLLQANVCRFKRDLRAEHNAKEISDSLPFLEYELHRQLINKLKVKGKNAIFGLRSTAVIGERMIALMATGTAVYLAGLPPAVVPKVVAGNSWTDMDKLGELQKILADTFDRNRETYNLKYNLLTDNDLSEKYVTSDTDDSDDDTAEMDLNAGNKETCILEIDDVEDIETIATLTERCPPDGFYVVNTQTVPGLTELESVKNLQMFTQVWRAKFTSHQCNLNLAKNFNRILQGIYYKLRHMVPCAICSLHFRLSFPEPDEIQLLVTGMTLGLAEKVKPKKKIVASGRNDEELIFNLEEDIVTDLKPTPSYQTHLSQKYKSTLQVLMKDRYGVEITPLNYVAGGVIEKYLGNLNFFLIRESFSVRENGGISGFIHNFLIESLAVVRAHVQALNGNAMVAFFMTELILVDNPHKNQAQCILSVGGDVVQVSYKKDE